MSLLEGIQYAERAGGVATSAKLEVEDGKLMLSVYLVPEGLAVEPALHVQPGTPMDVRNPMLRGGHAVADVVIIDKQQNVVMVTVTVTVNLLDSRTTALER